MHYLLWTLCIAIAFACHYKYRMWNQQPVKNFTSAQKTNILITGGLHGLGKLLAERFARDFNKDEVNLIVISKSDDKLAALQKSLDTHAGKEFKNLFFYTCNVTDVARVEQVWAEIL